MHTLRLALAPLLAALILAPALDASAQTGARAYLERRHEEVNRILRTPAGERRSQRLTRLLNELIDYEALSREALGEHWEAQSAEERQRFVSLLRQLVERNYETNLERILDYEVSYEGERRRGDRTVVTTSARSRAQRRQPPVEIAYAMVQSGSDWRVVDVTTDGVSMVQNYRNQFSRIIDREGWAELISRMESRLEQGADG
ncbi:MAG: ABC transporter substrate-binding protein [Myxococcota bacterium]|nr:ABC transporter substrate-binding protein [Myxococcota bacterium]